MLVGIENMYRESQGDTRNHIFAETAHFFEGIRKLYSGSETLFMKGLREKFGKKRG